MAGQGEHMRRIVVFERVTVDGCFAASDGGLDWFVPDESLDEAAAGGVGGFDAMLFGRHTFEMFAAYWPNAVNASATAEDPHHAGRRSSAIHTMAVWLNETPKWVFSTTLRDPGWRNSRVLPALDPSRLAAMKREPGRDMIVFGSGSIVAQLAQHGLVDEYRLVLSPLLLGGGRPLFEGVTKRMPLTLLEAAPYPSGNVLLRYASVE